VAVLIPSIDLLGGKIVQLIQGEKKALEFDDFEQWIERFINFPLVQLIDLDAAIGSGDNRGLLQYFLSRLPCQVGGGIRSVESARQVLDLGARRVILGSALVRDGQIDSGFAAEVANSLGTGRLVFAVDAKRGRVAVRGWREQTSLSPVEMVRSLDPWCDAFLYTHIDTEGLMQGIPLEAVRSLRKATSKQLIVAGGISTNQEIAELHGMGADSVVGMALYLGKLNIDALQPGPRPG
jgi:phosphoribosylformimino-5-aminoimidazole carboxamide ribotide isomerase